MTKEERHATREKCGKEFAERLIEFINIQEDYIVWLEDQLEQCSGMPAEEYTKLHPRE